MFSVHMRVIAWKAVSVCGWARMYFWTPLSKFLEQVTNFHETLSERHATDDSPPNAEFPMINTNNMAEARYREVGATLVMLNRPGC
jgi:hypothetical protein